MEKRITFHAGLLLRFFALLPLAFAGMRNAEAGGVTVITHGFSGNVTDWIIPMAEAVPRYPLFPGASYSCYQISITRNGSGQYIATASFLGGTQPTATDSGEILVKLDWSTLASFGGASSTNVATAASAALLSPTLIPEMGGRPLAELPIHLIGHSRGGSVVTEMARLLGAQGVWVDHVTTLDPRPVSALGDASVSTYANVLFADNFWQTMGDGLIVPNGQAVFGAYNRKLLDLNGGYSSSHSDVHLWYHGTLDLNTPATDTQATISSTQRSTWWTTAESTGAATGFRYSLIGGGDRLSQAEPAGVGDGRISDGFNGFWDLGGGFAPNRTALTSNSGLWPNVIRVALTHGAPVPAGEPFMASLYYQSGATTANTVELRVLLDPDFNPYNGNEIEIDRRSLPNTGTSGVAFTALEAGANPATVPPGVYALCTSLSDGTRTRYHYAPSSITITPSLQAPAIDADSLTRPNAAMRFNVLGFPGQNVTIMATTDFVSWTPVGTHLFTSTVWEFTDAEAGQFSRRFYRAELAPQPTFVSPRKETL